jgi:hypothetical protein
MHNNVKGWWFFAIYIMCKILPVLFCESSTTWYHNLKSHSMLNLFFIQQTDYSFQYKYLLKWKILTELFKCVWEYVSNRVLLNFKKNLFVSLKIIFLCFQIVLIC